MKVSAMLLAVLICLGVSTVVQAQTASPDNPPPVYSGSVVSRSTPAVNYEHRGDSTKIDFQGTNLMPGARGWAKVQSKRGDTKISANFEGLQAPAGFGNEYLTYVLWAISPEGRPINLGEVLLGGDHKSKLDVTTNLQTFALIVTAEPYYAVRRPSNVVVAENVVRPDTVGTTQPVNAKYELIDRGGYIPTGYQFDPVVLNSKLPLEFFEARNAVRIAKSAGAATYAGPSYEKAVIEMKRADEMAIVSHVDKKSLISASREIVQTADDAREIAVKRIDADRLSSDQAAAAAQVAAATAKSNEDAQARASAEAAAASADHQRAEAERAAALA